MKKIFLVMLLLTAGFALFSQATGFGIGWKSIEGTYVTIVFPEGMEEKARETAAFMDSIYPELGSGIGDIPERFTIVLDNFTTISNGYVTYFPVRSRWFHTAPPEAALGSGDWFQLLGIHEGRHMAQFTSLNRNFTRFASVIYGDYGRAGMSFFTIPGWFMEGDAVVTETLFTDSGRGRVPGFLQETLIYGDRLPHYRTIMNDSLALDLPNIYEYGYFMAAYLRRNYGEDVLERIIESQSVFSLWPWSFEIAVKKHTGLSMQTHQQAMINELADLYPQELLSIEDFEVSAVDEDRTVYLGRSNDRGEIALVVGGPDEATRIQVFGVDGSKKENVRFSANSSKFGFAGDTLVWTEFVPHPSVPAKASSRLVLYRDGKRTTLSSNLSWQEPDISQDEKRIVLVEIDRSMNHSLVLIRDQEVENRINFPSGTQLSYPLWTGRGDQVIVSVSTLSGKTYELVNMRTGDREVILEAGLLSLGDVNRNGDLVFSGIYQNRPGIFLYRNGEMIQIAESLLGLRYPFFLDGKVHFTAKDGQNYRHFHVSGDEIQPSYSFVVYTDPLTKPVLSEPIPNTEPAKPYFADLPKLHSWGFLYNGSPGFFTESQSITENVFFLTEMYYSPATRDALGAVNLGIAAYPFVFNLSAAGLVNQDLETQFAFPVGLSIPLQFSSGAWYSAFNLSASAVISEQPAEFDYSFAAVHALPGGRRSLGPDFALSYGAEAGNTVTDFTEPSYYGFYTSLSLPGFFKGQSIEISGSAAFKPDANLTRYFPGIALRSVNSELGAENYAGSLVYSFPLAYADTHLGMLYGGKAWIGRVFGDFAYSDGTSSYAAGAELTHVFRLFQIPVDLEAGVRFYYDFMTQEYRVEDTLLGFGVNF
jgi:hypothetical protein